MKIQFLNGGLANQAFQYIFARYYELSHPGDVMYMDDSYFALHTVHNGYELEKVFGIKPHMLSECFDDEVWNYILEERKKGKSVPQILCDNGIEMCMISEVDGYMEFNPFEGKVLGIPANEYHPEIMDYPGDVYYHGYWINKNYFARYVDVFRQEFRFPDITDADVKRYYDEIKDSLSVSIHIRRGDYVTLGVQYNEQLIKGMVEKFAEQMPMKWHLFVFSDDITWCKKNREKLGFDRYQEVTFVEGNVCGKNYIDMQLMSQCKAMIMSNSSFCYLAALLNTEKVYALNWSPRELM